MYRPGAAEYHLALARFFRGRLTAADLDRGDGLAAAGRGVQNQHLLAALRVEWELSRGNDAAALVAVEAALSVVRRTGEAADYFGLRAHALARLGRADDARDALAEGARAWDDHLPRFPFHAAETWLALGDAAAARDYLLRAHRCAWADGPRCTHRYYLERCRERMAHSRLPEPRLPESRAAAAAPVPLEKEVRAAIAQFRVRR